MRQPIIFSLVCNKQVDKYCCAWWWLITEIDCSSKEVIQEKKWQVLPCGQWFLDPWPISAISKILVIRWRSNAVQSTARLKCTKISLGWRIIGSSLPLLIVASMLQQCHQAVHHEVTRTKHLISIMDGGAVTRPRAAQRCSSSIMIINQADILIMTLSIWVITDKLQLNGNHPSSKHYQSLG